MKKLHLDFECRSEADLKQVGYWAYAAHPSTEILCSAWGVEGKEPFVSLHGDWHNRLVPFDLNESIIVAHNAPFEYAIYNLILHKKFGWPAKLDPTHWDCTMARAAACRLPHSLEMAAAALRISAQKDMGGSAVMRKLCSPGKDGKFNNDPALLQRLYRYCAQDVKVEMELDKVLPPLSREEKKVWNLDLVINRRGICIDTALCEKAAELTAPLTDSLNARIKKLTRGEVPKGTQLAKMKKFIHKNWRVSPPVKGSLEDELGLEEGGVYLDSIDKTKIAELLDSPQTPYLIKDIVEIRGQVNKSSTSKYKRALGIVAGIPDNRARGLMRYHGAGTGRWTAQLLQPQNFPSGRSRRFPKGLKPKQLSSAITSIKGGDINLFKAIYAENSMEILSAALRGMFIAGPGKQLVCADFNAIEARVLFWLAGDEAALNTYRKGESPYVEMAQYIFKNNAITKETHLKEYDIGKRTILGCGYQMGAKRFKETCWEQGNVVISEELAETAVSAYREKYGLVKQLWYSAQGAAIAAIKLPGTRQYAAGGKIQFAISADGRFLECTLPSTRILRYYAPSIAIEETKWGQREEIRFWGVHPQTHKWARLKAYGGMLVENVTQATARDLMVNAMFKCEAAGYETVLTVHDELLAEVSAERGDCVKDFILHMTNTPLWASGCPIKAEGWVGERYRK